jgi:cupin 2 domain-containing protein
LISDHAMLNLFDNIPAHRPEELVQTTLNRPNLRIERIVSKGHASPEDFLFDQEQNKFVVLLKGAARLRIEDEVIDLKPGSFTDIPAHRRHRVEWTSPDEPTMWLAVFYEDSNDRRQLSPKVP